MEKELIYSISEIDKTLQLKEKLLKDKTIPHQLFILRNDYNSLKSSYEALIKEERERSSLIRDLSNKNKDLSSELNSIENLLYSSKSLKDIEVLQLSLDRVKKDMEANDEIVYKNLDAQENAKKLGESYKIKLNEVSRSYNALKGEYTNNMELTKNELNTLLKRREGLISKVNSNLILQYEEIRKHRGYGMSILKGETCTGCGISVPYIIISEVKKNKLLQKCPNCERFLYYSE